MASLISSSACTADAPCSLSGKALLFFLDVYNAIWLTVLFMFVPLVFRILARWEGTTQRTHVELSIMDRVFVFKMIVRASHVFLNKRFSHVQ
jgi:hypothetical protein